MAGWFSGISSDDILRVVSQLFRAPASVNTCCEGREPLSFRM